MENLDEWPLQNPKCDFDERRPKCRTDSNTTSSIHLKNVLRQIQANYDNLFHRRLKLGRLQTHNSTSAPACASTPSEPVNVLGPLTDWQLVFRELCIVNCKCGFTSKRGQ